ncbi:MAG: hypothetical protein RLZZ148_216 [Cyanobacteriota bacterium]|jgi:hypothetical protein
MAYSQDQMEFAHMVAFRLKEILEVCPNVDEKSTCWTVHEKAHQRCYDLMVLLAEITNLPEYLEFLGNHPETKVNPYGFITALPPAKRFKEDPETDIDFVQDIVDLEQ